MMFPTGWMTRVDWIWENIVIVPRNDEEYNTYHCQSRSLLGGIT